MEDLSLMLWNLEEKNTKKLFKKKKEYLVAGQKLTWKFKKDDKIGGEK